jgi:LytS/YehU family sensor histidine kinase
MELSKLLRYVLYESDKEFVPLSKELEFTSNYIELMKLRLQSNVELEVNIQDNNNNIIIAPLLFISLIENMFKHGVAANKQLKSFIHINIYTDENHTIVCKLKNSHHPKDATSDKSGSGIGIENLKRRLELIYPSNHSFTSTVEENVYYSTLIINPIIKNEI